MVNVWALPVIEKHWPVHQLSDKLIDYTLSQDTLQRQVCMKLKHRSRELTDKLDELVTADRISKLYWRTKMTKKWIAYMGKLVVGSRYILPLVTVN